MGEITVVGATGMCATAFIKEALKRADISRIWTFARRKNDEIPQTEKVVEFQGSAEEWESAIPPPSGKDSLFFSGIATTRAAAGDLEKQKLVDHDLQVKMAKIAKAKGYSTFVLISSAGANINSYFGYLKMKGEIERDITSIGFDRTIIVRPGPLLGRKVPHNGFGSGVMESLGPHFYRSWCSGLAKYPVYGSDVARAVLNLSKTASEGVTIIEGKQITDLADKQ